MATRRDGTLRLYGQPSAVPPLEWDWVERQLAAAGTYWVDAAGGSRPHPRPVWGVWHREQLQLSVGSPALRARLATGTEVTVHLDSGVDVVIVEGAAAGSTAAAAVIAAYQAKYDWDYDADTYGPFATVAPVRVLAWRSGGWAGRESFRQIGAWTYSRT